MRISRLRVRVVVVAGEVMVSSRSGVEVVKRIVRWRGGGGDGGSAIGNDSHAVTMLRRRV